MGVSALLKQRALEIGFDLVGIAPLAAWQDLEFSRNWVERGLGGEMRYLENPKRHDPRRLLPSVKSVVCVGLLYDTPYPYSTETVGSGQKAVGRKQESRFGQPGATSEVEGGVRGQEPEATTPTVSQPSHVGIGWTPPRRGTGEGEVQESRFSSFEFPVSNFQFPVSRTAEPRAWISRYAWGKDYHEVMRAKLGKLRAVIETLALGAETRAYVDTGPIVERAFARYSGIGWMGKNTCIINEEKGSWFFLGVILTNLALEPDLPAPDRCGTCRACLDACPTGALIEPYVMDASKCISYLTIELKGSIPRELRPSVGVNIFGCDICQDVCPWNAKGRSQESEVRSQEECFQPSAVSGHPTDNLQSSIINRQSSAPAPQSPAPNTQHLEPSTQPPAPSTFSLFHPPLESLAELTEDDLRKVFAHSPIRRAKYRGWLRNLCIAMANSGDARFVPWLERLAHGDNAMLREHAVWALERIADAEYAL